MEASAASPAHCSLTMKEEDYLESILNISEMKGYAKSRDVSEDLSVSPSSASEMFVKLAKKGLIVHRKYEGVTLTETGRSVAVQVRFRHDVLVEFLKYIGVSDEIADKDACFMEHELHTETIQLIKEFVEKKR